MAEYGVYLNQALPPTPTGEMEALTAVSIAALRFTTCAKRLIRETISDVRLNGKAGQAGDYQS